MALSDKAKGRLIAAIANRAAGTEVAKRLDGAAAVADIATANATDLATAQALANQTKTTVNALLAALRAAGLLN